LVEVKVSAPEAAVAETPVESETRLMALAIWAAVAPSLKLKTWAPSLPESWNVRSWTV